MNEILSLTRTAGKFFYYVCTTHVYMREKSNFLPVVVLLCAYSCRPKLSGKFLCYIIFLIFRLSAHSGVFS